MADLVKKINKKWLFKMLSLILAVIWGFFAICIIATFVIRKKFYPTKYKDQVLVCSQEFNLPVNLIFAVINTESSFNPTAVSKAGAVGLMQIKPSTANFIADKLLVFNYKLTDPDTNIRFGCYYLRYLINKFKITETALCAYNAGESTVDKWLKDKRYSLDGVNLKSIPYKETANYITKINKCLINYKKLYGNFLDKRLKFS